jgi:WD40 repeat protein
VPWDDRGLSLTPIPRFNEVITTDNVARVDAIAVWGNGKANTIALSPDNSILAVGTGIGAYLYESINFLLLTILPTPDTVHSIAFSPDNRSIALGQAQGRIDIIDLDSQALITRLLVPSIDFSSPHHSEVLFSPNGGYLTSVITMQSNIFVNRWETATWQPAVAFTLASGLVSYTNHGTDLLGIIDQDRLTLQSLAAPEETTTIPLPTSVPRAFWEQIPALNGDIAPSSIGDFILINNGTSVLHWNVLELTIPYRLDQYPASLPDPCFEAPISCRNSQGSLSWVCETGSLIPPVEMIRLTPDNATMLVSRNDNRVELRQTADGVLIWAIDTELSEARFSTNFDFFMGLKPDGTIEKRDLSDGALIYSLNQHPSQLYALAFSPDGGALAVGYNDGWIRVYSPRDGELLGVLDGSATALQFSPDGRLLAAGLEGGTVRIFELAEGRNYDLLNGHFDTVTGLTFSAEGSALLTGSDDCTISLWDVEGRYRRSNTKPGGVNPFQIAAIALSSVSDNQYVLAKGNGIFQITDAETIVLFSPANRGLGDMTLSPDGRLLAAAGPGAWLIPAAGVDPLGEPQQLTPSAGINGRALAFTPNGAMLIIASAESLAFWSVPAGRNLTELPFSPASQGTNLPVDLTVSPNGTLIALGRQDGLIHIFAVGQ